MTSEQCIGASLELANGYTTEAQVIDDPDETLGCDSEFGVRDAVTANWVVRKVAAARQYATRVQEFAAAELRRAELEEQRLLQRFGSQLEMWLRDALARENSKRRSVALPAGRVGLRKQPFRIEINDESSVLEWAQSNLVGGIKVDLAAQGAAALHVLEWSHKAEFPVQVNAAISKTDLRRHFVDTGEVPPGTAIVEPGDQLRIE